MTAGASIRISNRAIHLLLADQLRSALAGPLIDLYTPTNADGNAGLFLFLNIPLLEATPNGPILYRIVAIPLNGATPQTRQKQI
jgi:hypothetical protein